MLDSPTEAPPRGSVSRAGGIEVHLLRGDVPARFAASELARYLPRLLPGAELEVYVGSPALAMGAAGMVGPVPDGEDAILVRGGGRRYVVAGGSPAAVLHAAYAFLEALGARWLMPGLRGEVVGPLGGPPPILSMVSAPAFSRRGLADGCLSWWPGDAPFHRWMEEMRELVDWMGKMRMSRLFVHFNRLPPGDLSPLLPELERRGIALELGGHNLPKLLPAGILEAQAGLSRWWQGKRRRDGNFCVGNRRTLQLLQEGARRYVEQLPPARLYHLWPFDAKDPAWCSCPECRDLSAGEQMWRAVAAAAEGVVAARPGAGVSGLLYHETLGAAAGAPEGVEVSFAPRERCRLHPIVGDCGRNRALVAHLRGALEHRGDGLSLLEYYGDPILLGRPANRVDVVASDLLAYRRAGVRSVSSLVFGALSWWLYPLQLYGYARASWDPASVESAMGDFCRAVAGDVGGETLARYYRLEGEAAGTHLRFCGYGRDGSWATLPFPPAAPAGEARRHLAEMRRGETLLREASDLLARLGAPGNARGHLLDSAVAAHRLEEAFHRAVAAKLAGGVDGGDGGFPDPLIEAAEAMEEAPPEMRGVFGSHWMLPWLRRGGVEG